MGWTTPGCSAQPWAAQQLHQPGAGSCGSSSTGSLVEQVTLEGAGQGQPGDLSQPVLAQGQPHCPAAQIHQGQGFGCGERDGDVNSTEQGGKVTSLLVNPPRKHNSPKGQIHFSTLKPPLGNTANPAQRDKFILLLKPPGDTTAQPRGTNSLFCS